MSLNFEELHGNKIINSDEKSCLKWVPTSSEKLYNAEEVLLQASKIHLSKGYVKLPSNNYIWTVVANHREHKTPLVLIHGMGGGTGLWALNYEELGANRPLYAMDLLGFGQSSRPHFSSKPEKSENMFVNSIEEWRKSLKIEKMILLGHSFGGYISASYSILYPNRVKKLILADPWGFETLEDRLSEVNVLIKCILGLFSCCGCNPLFAMRVAGPYGPRLMSKRRPDFRERFKVITNENKNAVHNYIYHCNAAKPTGEEGFKSLTTKAFFPKYPMLDRIDKINCNIPIVYIFGADSWLGDQAGEKSKHLLPNHYIKIYSIKDASHHVYADQADKFNEIVKLECDQVTSL